MNFIGHFKTITKHRHEVIKNSARAGILWQGLRHDLSKYMPSEFMSGARFYLGSKSPNEMEREVYGYSKAWLHHKGRNKHHFEYWTDYDAYTKELKAVQMPRKYVVEMFCDRVAAGKIYKGKDYDDSQPLQYFLGLKATRMIHPTTSDEMEMLLRMLAEKGEEETFRFIRKWRKEEKRGL